MCGIAGVVSFRRDVSPPSVELLRSMIGTLRHRGPDEFGYYRDAVAGIAHARLSIIDLTSGQQPLSNENGTLWIVFNGEIFNYIELRRELLSLGHRFRTNSDTEVIIHSFEAWGHECFRRFNGQWALALWDNRNRTIVLARDRFGVRPLYIRETADRLWFGSEVKAIFADSSVPRAIDQQGIDQIFTYWAPIAPVTPFAGIEEVRPGSFRTYRYDGSCSETIYWQPEFPPADYFPGDEANRQALNEATTLLREKLLHATSLRMLRSDVPVGSYLSGGLDSSLIAWMGHTVASGEFRTFSIRFEDEEFDETRYQRLMVSALGSRHEEYIVTRRDIAEIFPTIIHHTERPLLRTGPAPLFLLSKLVRSAGFKAVLTGEGADEILAGYDIFREDKIRRFVANSPSSKIRPRLFDRLYPYLARSPQQSGGIALEFWKQGLDRVGQRGFSHDLRWRTTSGLKKFFSDDLRERLRNSPSPDILSGVPDAFDGWDPLAQAQYLEIISLFSPYIISSQGDRMLMANSVEGRFPFLDADVVGFCNALPADYKLAGLEEKQILRRVAAGILPDEILRRTKQPYRAPDAICFVEQGAPEYVGEMFSETMLRETGLFNVGMVRNLFGKVSRMASDRSTAAAFSFSDNMAIVGILSAQLLCSSFLRDATGSQDPIYWTTAVDRASAESGEDQFSG
jgi:asparagine synthase (glutamine-hydrolysing)